MYQDRPRRLLSGVTYTEKFSQMTAQHAYEAQIVREGVAAALAPYLVTIPAQRQTSEPGPIRP